MSTDDLTDHVPISPLDSATMNADPLVQFSSWLGEAEQAGIPLPNAMTLATANSKGQPSARMVLLKGVEPRGFLFYSSYESRKAMELHENPYAALVFHWLPLSRQVRVEGTVETLAESESDRYFATRPRGHQLEAHASPQSRVIPDRAFLERQFREAESLFAGQQVPRPQNWGGFLLVPAVLEFWQEGAHRLHDRYCYRRDPDGGWTRMRLAP